MGDILPNYMLYSIHNRSIKLQTKGPPGSKRVLFSSDHLYRFNCDPSLPAEILYERLADILQNLGDGTPNIEAFNCRTQQVISTEDRFANCVVDGDLLTVNIQSRSALRSIDLVSVPVSEDLRPKISNISRLNGFEEDVEDLLREPTRRGNLSGNSELSDCELSQETRYSMESSGKVTWRKSHQSIKCTDIDGSAFDVERRDQGPATSTAQCNTSICTHRQGQDLFLQASIQLSDNATYYQHEIRQIYHAVRSLKTEGSVKVSELLPRLYQLMVQDKRPVYLSAGISIIMNGWLFFSGMKRRKKAEDGQKNTLISNFGLLKGDSMRAMNSPFRARTIASRKLMWVVLYEGQLGCFNDEESGQKYTLALSKSQKGMTSKLCQRMMQEYAPVFSINILGCQFQSSADEIKNSTIKLPANSIALWPYLGEEQYVIECETEVEFVAWLSHLQREAQTHLMKIHDALQKLSGESYIDFLRIKLPISVPLRWLRMHVDQLDSSARYRRMCSANMSQALKDLKREASLEINGKRFNDKCLEDIISEIAVLILQQANVVHQGNSLGECSDTDVCTSTTAVRGHGVMQEMEAVQLARRVLIYATRTQGGGNVLEAIHLLLQSPCVCVCPDPSIVEPIKIFIGTGCDGQIEIEVVVKMYFKLIPMKQAASNTNQHEALLRNQNTLTDNMILGRVIGVSNQRVKCQFEPLADAQGEVALNLFT